MQFKTYLKTKNISQSAACKELKMNNGRLSKILNGKESPTLLQVNDIYEFTKHEVTYWDWYELIRSRKNAEKK